MAALAVILVVASPWLYQVAMTVRDAKKSGWLDDVEVDKYQAGRENNLKAIHKALVQAAESDGQFPPAATWMDAALIRLKTSDLTEEETKIKLRVPGQDNGGYGYAINVVIAGKKPEELKSVQDAVLVFESNKSAWNASGDPDKDARKAGKGITLAGEIVPVGESSASGK